MQALLADAQTVTIRFDQLTASFTRRPGGEIGWPVLQALAVGYANAASQTSAPGGAAEIGAVELLQ